MILELIRVACLIHAVEIERSLTIMEHNALSVHSVKGHNLWSVGLTLGSCTLLLCVITYKKKLLLD